MLIVNTRRTFLLSAVLTTFTVLTLLAGKETEAQNGSAAVQEAPALTVEASANSVDLRWNAVIGAASYDLRTWWAGASG